MTCLTLRTLLRAVNRSLQKVASSHNSDAAPAAELHVRELSASGREDLAEQRPELTAPKFWDLHALQLSSARRRYHGCSHRLSHRSRPLHHLRARALIPEAIRAPEPVCWSFDTRVDTRISHRACWPTPDVACPIPTARPPHRHKTAEQTRHGMAIAVGHERRRSERRRRRQCTGRDRGHAAG